MSRSPLLLLLAACAPAVGCKPSRPRTYPVSGTVTFDGKPLDAGFIRFAPNGAEFDADAAPINQGAYSIQLVAGPMQVRVHAARTRPDGPRGAMGELVPEEFIPPRYNRQSELSATVSPDGANVFDFALQSARK